jgi:hypothetical protein
MKKRFLGTLVCAMVLITILSITAQATMSRATPEPITRGILNKTYVRGFAINLGLSPTGKITHLFALRLHYFTYTGTGLLSVGVLKMRPIDIPTQITGFHGHFYIAGSFHGYLKV